MNRIVLLLLLVLILPAYAHALDLPFIGGDKKDAEDADKAAQEEKKGKTKFLIHFKTGGVLETDNYTVTEDSVMVMMPSGAIYLDKKMVSSIEEVAGIEEEPVQSIEVAPGGPAAKPAPRPAEGAAQPQAEVQESVERDDEGHTEQWWQARVQNWKEKKAKAEEDFADAEEQWSKADGDLANLTRMVPAPLTPEQQKQKQDDPEHFVQPMTTVGSEYDIIRVQDLRGSARVAMDRAKAEIEEADRMLNEELPDEARKAGAPPGWVR